MNTKVNQIFNPELNESSRQLIIEAILDFDNIKGGHGKRNFIKQVSLPQYDINIKSFKIPNFFNRIVYKFLRKSKARRSFEYGLKLLQMDIDTPQPLAYFEFSTFLFFDRSFYISRQFDYQLTYRELINNQNYPNFEAILRAFTRFTFKLHENNVNFLDHSPGNTLINWNVDKNAYDFYLVDLNRMKFHDMDFDDRMKNFAKLSPRDKMLDIMSDEYSKIYQAKTKEQIIERMYFYSRRFSTAYEKKEAFKKKYYFWRK